MIDYSLLKEIKKNYDRIFNGYNEFKEQITKFEEEFKDVRKTVEHQFAQETTVNDGNIIRTVHLISWTKSDRTGICHLYLVNRVSNFDKTLDKFFNNNLASDWRYLTNISIEDYQTVKLHFNNFLREFNKSVKELDGK